MAINRFLIRSALVSLAVTTALAGCSSVEPSTKTARLSKAPAPATAETAEAADPNEDATPTETASAVGALESVALTKTGRLVITVPDTNSAVVAQNAAMASPAMAPQVAYATTAPVSATTAAAAIQTVALGSQKAPPSGFQNANTDPATTASVPATDAALRAQAVAPDENELTPDMHALQAAIPTPRPDTKALAYAAQPAALSTLQDVDTRTQFPPAPGDPLPETAKASPPTLTKLIKRYSGLYGVPESLVHRVVQRESRYDPKAYHKDGYWGLMQIKYATAKSMGYVGKPEGLLDAETNLKYAVKYLRGAWLVADNSNDNAIRLYARGYYYDAKRRGMLHVLK